MREKILAQLILKYAGVSKKVLGLWADKLALKVTEESAIQGVIDELDNLPVSIPDLATEFQKEGDRRVNEALVEWKKKTPVQQQQPTNDSKPETQPTDETPAWAKALMQQVESLTKEKVPGGMKVKLAEKLKDIPASYYAKRALPEKEEELEAFIEEVKTDYGAFKQELVNQGLLTNTPPAGGETGIVKSDNIDADIDAWVGKSPEAKSSKT